MWQYKDTFKVHWAGVDVFQNLKWMFSLLQCLFIYVFQVMNQVLLSDALLLHFSDFLDCCKLTVLDLKRVFP